MTRRGLGWISRKQLLSQRAAGYWYRLLRDVVTAPSLIRVQGIGVTLGVFCTGTGVGF